MALILQTLSLLAATTLTVYGCVCYVGQELDHETGKRYGWSLAEKTPCECTEFRLGGVNTKPQIKPYEVNSGEYWKDDQHAWNDPLFQVPGLIKHVSIGGAGVWAIDVQSRVYYKGSSCGCLLTLIPGIQSGSLEQLDVGMNAVWGTSIDFKIYYCVVSVSKPDITPWVQVQGLLKHVSVSQKGHVWGVNHYDKIYHRRNANVNQIDGTGWIHVEEYLKQISVGSGGVWGISPNGAIYYRTGTYDDPDSDPDGSGWERLESDNMSLKYVSSGDVIYVVDTNDRVYYREGTSADNPTGTVWQKIDGNLKQIESISNTFWGIDAEQNNLYTNESLSHC